MSVAYKPDHLEKIQQTLFLTDEEAEKVITPALMERRKRLRLCILKLMSNPAMPEGEIVSFLRSGCGGMCQQVSISAAYTDISAINLLVEHIKMASKEWHRYMVVEMCKKAYALAQSQQDPKAMAMAADKIGKYMRVEQLDADKVDYDKFVPPSFEPTDDTTILELPKIDNLKARRAELRKMLKANYTEPNETE